MVQYIRIVIITRERENTSHLLAKSQQKKNTMEDDKASILAVAVHYFKIRDVIHDTSDCDENDKLQLQDEGDVVQTTCECFTEEMPSTAISAEATILSSSIPQPFVGELSM